MVGLAHTAGESKYRPDGVFEIYQGGACYNTSNTGFVTLLNWNKDVYRNHESTEKAALTLAHEIGHSFGAKNDEDTSCTNNPGKFLMAGSSGGEGRVGCYSQRRSHKLQSQSYYIII